MSVAIFFSFFSLLVLAGGLYLARRFGRAFPPGHKGRLAALLCLWALLALPLSNFLLRKTAYYQASFHRLTFIVIGFLSLVLVFYLFTDLTLLLRRLAKRKKTSQFNPSRREFFTKTFQASVLTASGALTSVGHALAYATPQVRQLQVPLGQLPAPFHGLKIMQLSDLHVGPLIRKEFVEAVVEACLKLSPDVIAYTGDFVDGSVDELAEHIAPLAKLHAPYGSYFVTGNHEYYSGVLPWIKHWQHLGVKVLLNEHVVLEKDGAQLVLAGVTDLRGGRHHPSHISSPRQSLQGAPLSAPKILLAHQPRSIYEAASTGFDLQLSGHTHAGQYFPFTLLIHAFQPYVSGLNLHEKTWIYVNQGTGFWGPPNRLGANSEISLLTLIPA